ncbi:manganese transporter [Pseudooceanicola sp. 216_PA32_1]|uniref:Manganese transporter n=1 Tax=Pseudooceanicola pacificus TaxID=2676438 RepID=A0A844W1L3_9RHOB|nr:zinc ABC transporter substrate-binding protein [Pseudooceanicola pacificus]MWB76691.1 manganese transporter [Pseudooceanicola pacificus]
MTLSRRQLLTSATALPLAVALPIRLSAAEPMNVVATTGMIADTAMRIGGDLVEVKGLMGPGVDPHSYRQTRTDIVAMTRADLVLCHGLYLEAQMEEFLHALARRRSVVAVAEAVPRDKLRAHADYADKFDPHVWMDPILWRPVAAAVAGALSEVRPEGADVFAANLAELDETLVRLDAYAREVLATIPDNARVLVTAHDAFSYFGRAYDMEVLGIQGISTESEAGLNRIRALVDTLVERRVGAVFVESSVSDRNMRALIEGAAAQGHEVRIGGELFSDAMGLPGTYEGTYPGMIDHNVTTIAAALGGTVPERGMDGRLKAGI